MPSRHRKTLACLVRSQSTGDTDPDHAGNNLVDSQQQSSNHHQPPINRRRQRFPLSQMTKPARDRQPAELTHWLSERRHQRPKIRGEAESAVSRAPLSRGQPVAPRETENATQHDDAIPIRRRSARLLREAGGRGGAFFIVTGIAQDKSDEVRPPSRPGHAFQKKFSHQDRRYARLDQDCRDEFPCRRARRFSGARAVNPEFVSSHH